MKRLIQIATFLLLLGPLTSISGNEVILLDESFDSLDAWHDISLLRKWGPTPETPRSAFEVGTDTVDTSAVVVRLTDIAQEHGGFDGNQLTAYACLDFLFADPIDRRASVLTFEYRIRWDRLYNNSKGEANRFMIALNYEYPEAGLPTQPDERFRDFSEEWWGRPAYHIRMRGSDRGPLSNPENYNTIGTTMLEFGGGGSILGEYEHNQSFWMPGFISSPGAGVSPRPTWWRSPFNGSPGNAPGVWPNVPWVHSTKGGLASTEFQRFRWVIRGDRQELWVNFNDDGETWELDAVMPLPDDMDGTPLEGIYQSFEYFEGIRLFWVSARVGSNVYLDSLQVRLDTVDPLRAWRRTAFGTELDDPAKEADLWGATNDPDGDGIANLVEYALGSSPLEAGGTLPFVLEPAASADDSWQLSLHRRANVGEVEVIVESSSKPSGSTWTPVPLTDSTPLGESMAADVYNIGVPSTASQFFRIRVEQTETGD